MSATARHAGGGDLRRQDDGVRRGKYEPTSRGGKGFEAVKRTSFVRVVPPPIDWWTGTQWKARRRREGQRQRDERRRAGMLFDEEMSMNAAPTADDCRTARRTDGSSPVPLIEKMDHAGYVHDSSIGRSPTIGMRMARRRFTAGYASRPESLQVDCAARHAGTVAIESTNRSCGSESYYVVIRDWSDSSSSIIGADTYE